MLVLQELDSAYVRGQLPTCEGTALLTAYCTCSVYPVLYRLSALSSVVVVRQLQSSNPAHRGRVCKSQLWTGARTGAASQHATHLLETTSVAAHKTCRSTASRKRDRPPGSPACQLVLLLTNLTRQVEQAGATGILTGGPVGPPLPARERRWPTTVKHHFWQNEGLPLLLYLLPLGAAVSICMAAGRQHTPTTRV